MSRKSITLSIVIGLLALSNAYLIYRYVIHDDAKEVPGTSSQTYICPMHPHIQQDHPGVCPICNMELVLKGSGDEMEGMTGDDPDEELGEIAISPPQQVLANVQVQTVETGEFERSIDANGIVKLRDDAVGQISAPVKGKITKLYINYEGQKVSKGQPAFELYSPELIATQREFLLAYENFLKTQGSDIEGLKESSESVLSASKQRLLLWFVDEEEINELMESRQVRNSLTYYSDYSGVVTKKFFNEGSWVMEGNTILDVVDLTSVWVMANVYENEISDIRLRQSAEISFGGDAGESLRGRIDYINPFVNPDTRTIEVRITSPNQGLRLKPGMFVKVQIKTDRESNSVIVPRSAVLRSGKTDIVYVKKSDNVYSPRHVKIGGEKEGRVLIRSGLEPGETIVVSAGFLLDSESQIRTGSREGADEHSPESETQRKDDDVKFGEDDAMKDMNQHKH